MEIKTLLSALRVELGLEILAGHDGLDRRVTGDSVQKPGLALAGFREMFKPGRVQVRSHGDRLPLVPSPHRPYSSG